MTARTNFDVVTGTSFSVSVKLQYADGAAVNPSGWTFRAQVRDQPGGQVAAEMDFRLDGELTMLLTPAQTALLSEGSLPYDLIATAPESLGGEVFLVMHGELRVTQAVTVLSGLIGSGETV